MQTEEFLKRLQHLDDAVDTLNQHYSVKANILAGIIRGAATIVGAVLFVIVVSWLLKILGIIPGTEELTNIIKEAFYKVPN